uniref:WGS project CBMI000000000 data, contig CS3069_c004799 n=1 Tax=Fusarium clavum TaxID=2594811 RepID=A0A090N647_9HYPO|nr:unnamed protein product [Fusarium clavum]
MSSRPPSFLLPNSLSCRVIDRFSDLPDNSTITEDSEGKIPFWPLLHHLITTPVLNISLLIDRLQTIAANAETYPDGDFGFLDKFLREQDEDKIIYTIWSKIRQIALDITVYFPSGELELLRTGFSLFVCAPTGR